MGKTSTSRFAALAWVVLCSAGCQVPLESPLMNPGSDCMECHSPSGVSTRLSWTVAGTVYPSADAPAENGLPGVEIDLTDADGKVEVLYSNSAGNFYTREPLTFPLSAQLYYKGRYATMSQPVPAGDCASCHAAPPANGAPGRLYFPLVAENTQLLCKPCGSEADCGGNGNYCLQNPSGRGTGCGVGCDPDTAGSCPAGYDCVSVGQGSASAAFNCAPSGGADCKPPVQVCTKDTWSNYAQAFFTAACAGCHTHDHSPLTNLANFTPTYTSIVRGRIASGSMPVGMMLSSAERQRVLTWIDCGTPK